ncbi:ribonuclease P/MRP protein subunit RPP1, partial [Candida albicans P60002]
KLSFYLKFKTLNNATEKGIKFEICYSQLISGNTTNGGGGYIDDSTNTNLIKKNFFNNVLQLIRGCRSRGIIISSGAQTSLQLRNLSDILILLKTLSSSPSDLSKNNCSKFITINPERVLINGKLKQKSHRQTIVVNNDGDLLQEKQTISGSGGGFKKKLDDTSSGRLLKKRKTTK